MLINEEKIANIALEMHFAYAANRLSDYLEEAKIEQCLPQHPEYFARILDHIAELQLEHGYEEVASAIMYQLAIRIKDPISLAKVINYCEYIHLCFTEVAKAVDARQSELFFNNIDTDKLTEIIEKIYADKIKDFQVAIVNNHTNIEEARVELYPPIVSLFAHCHEGLCEYVDNPTLVAALFEGYYQINICSSPAMLLEIFFGGSEKNSVGKNAARCIDSVVNRSFICTLAKVKDPITVAKWLDVANLTQQSIYVEIACSKKSNMHEYYDIYEVKANPYETALRLKADTAAFARFKEKLNIK